MEIFLVTEQIECNHQVWADEPLNSPLFIFYNLVRFNLRISWLLAKSWMVCILVWCPSCLETYSEITSCTHFNKLLLWEKSCIRWFQIYFFRDWYTHQSIKTFHGPCDVSAWLFCLTWCFRFNLLSGWRLRYSNIIYEELLVAIFMAFCM